MRRAGIANGALYLVRPDGYIALADTHADPTRLRHYFAEQGLRQVTGAEQGRIDGIDSFHDKNQVNKRGLEA